MPLNDSGNNQRWIIYGATGVTGQMLIKLAIAEGMQPILAGRNETKLKELAHPYDLEVRVAYHRFESLRTIFSDMAVVAACVGPYSLYGIPVAEAAVACGAHYIDFNGEPRFFQQLLEQLDAKAVQSGSVLVPSAGLGACTCMAATIAARDLSSIDSLTVIYEPKEIKPSTGTVQSLIDIAIGGAPIFRQGKLLFIRFGKRLVKSPMGLSVTFPLTDPLALSRMWPNADIESTQLLPNAYFIWLLSPLFLLAKLKPFANYLKRKQASTQGATVNEAGGQIGVTVIAKSGSTTKTVSLKVDNMYDQTSKAGFISIKSLLNQQWPAGVRAFGEIIQNPEQAILDMGAELIQH